MPRCVALAPHLSPDALERRYRQCRDPVERGHWHMLWRLAQGHHCPAVARMVGYSEDWVRTIVHRYNAEGPDGVTDRRHGNPGATPLLSPEQKAALRDALAADPPDGGLWTSPKVAAWMTARVGHPVPKQRAWEAMRSLGFTLQQPRTRATAADPDAQEAVKKGGSPRRWMRVRSAHPGATVTVWAPCGRRPIARVRRRYAWLYVYGFMRPATGESWWCLLPTVNTVAMTTALAAFAEDEGIDARHRAVLVVDGAGWHTTLHLDLPDGIDLVFLPPASPELQPAERLWPLVNEPVANRAFADLDALADVLVTRCRTLRADQPAIRGLTDYWWWPSEQDSAIPD